MKKKTIKKKQFKNFKLRLYKVSYLKQNYIKPKENCCSTNDFRSFVVLGTRFSSCPLLQNFFDVNRLVAVFFWCKKHVQQVSFGWFPSSQVTNLIKFVSCSVPPTSLSVLLQGVVEVAVDFL